MVPTSRSVRAATTGLLFAVGLGVSGCFHAVIDTGRQPSGQVIEEPWAHSFVYGLVPPKVVETASRCPNGVAKVETQHSFLNGLVAALTFSLYTPMTITVQCAAGGSGGQANLLQVPANGDAAPVFQQAIEAARETGQAVFIHF